MRARLARSERPNRIFEVTLGVVRQAGLLGVRVLDSTPLYDAVATMETVTLVRSAIRGLLAASGEREPALPCLLRRDDDYRTSGKPAADWDDPDAGVALVDALEGIPSPHHWDRQRRSSPRSWARISRRANGGRVRIARRVAPDRVISTVDPETRHGH